MIDSRNVDNLTRPGHRATRKDVVRIARGPWAGRVGEVQDVHGKHLTVRVDPKWTRTQKARISDKIAELRDEGYERAQAVRVAFSEARERSPEAMKFLVNPDPRRARKTRARRKKSRARKARPRKNPRRKEKRKMARWIASEHPRNARGRFVRTTGRGHETRRRRRNAPARLHHPRERAYHHERWSSSEHPRNARGEFVRKRGSRRHNPYRRRNPGAGDLVTMLKDGVVDSVEIVVGKAAARSIPQIAKLPTSGNVGIAIQIGAALVLGYLGDRVSPEIGRNVLAGGLLGPLEDLIVTANVPWISSALSQTAVAAPASTSSTSSTSSAAGTAGGYALAPGQKLLPGAGWVTSPPGSGVSRFVHA